MSMKTIEWWLSQDREQNENKDQLKEKELLALDLSIREHLFLLENWVQDELMNPSDIWMDWELLGFSSWTQSMFESRPNR